MSACKFAHIICPECGNAEDFDREEIECEHCFADFVLRHEIRHVLAPTPAWSAL